MQRPEQPNPLDEPASLITTSCLVGVIHLRGRQPPTVTPPLMLSEC